MSLIQLFFKKPLLPTPFTGEDAEQFLQNYLKVTGRTTAQVFCDCYVASDKFLDSCKTLFDKIMKVKAQKV